MSASSNEKNLLSLMENRKAIIGVVGLGYVGLPLALAYSDAGYRVFGFDIDEKKKVAIHAGESYLRHISPTRIQSAASKDLLSVFTTFEEITKCDAVIICVPTPLGKHNEPDLSFVLSSIDCTLPYLRKGQILSLESTTYPGTTEEVVKPIIESSGLHVGEDIYLVFSPEREDPGNPVYHTSNIPKVLGGCTDKCSKVGEALYQNVVCNVVRVSSPRAAEMTKLLENIHRAVNIGLVNEMKIIADAMNIDIHEVINAAATKPFGFTPYKPGPGLGGHCIPIDPFYLTWKAKEYGITSRFIELAGEVNSEMPSYVVKKVAGALNQLKKSINGSKILLVGLSYKKNIDDCRESPTIAIANHLLLMSAQVTCYDPLFTNLPSSRKWGKSQPRFVSSIDEDTLQGFDACVICTDHDCIDYRSIAHNCRLVIDTRGRLERSDNVIPA